jgi:hypothetical protein
LDDIQSLEGAYIIGKCSEQIVYYLRPHRERNVSFIKWKWKGSHHQITELVENQNKARRPNQKGEHKCFHLEKHWADKFIEQKVDTGWEDNS